MVESLNIEFGCDSRAEGTTLRSLLLERAWHMVWAARSVFEGRDEAAMRYKKRVHLH